MGIGEQLHPGDNKIKMTRYSIQPRAIKCVKGYWFLSFVRIQSNKCEKKNY